MSVRIIHGFFISYARVCVIYESMLCINNEKNPLEVCCHSDFREKPPVRTGEKNSYRMKMIKMGYE